MKNDDGGGNDCGMNDDVMNCVARKSDDDLMSDDVRQNGDGGDDAHRCDEYVMTHLDYPTVI